VYLGEKNDAKIIIEEATKIRDNNGTVEIYSIFEESSKQKGYYIKEVDLMDNYIILERRGI